MIIHVCYSNKYILFYSITIDLDLTGVWPLMHTTFSIGRLHLVYVTWMSYNGLGPIGECGKF